ncbi:patatin-like phospholipase family protein [Streptomyces sp. CC208A]|uniref:patatin-like phospholipase family protein n=1 Tax=Streptomyces sp. CC208A TaxID=3044573 RepID=UPI0024A94B3F|nr:patatin-like phospholipase family protein [Streptomyces sp. CC208A]
MTDKETTPTGGATGGTAGGRTALVLGAGGLVGAAWEVGILHGLAEAGVDLSDADLVVGSSAGAVVGALLTSGTTTPAELYARQLDGTDAEPAVRFGAGTLLRYTLAVLTSRTPEAYGRKLGRLALRARTVDEATRRATVAKRLGDVTYWPDAGRLRLTAVDAESGALAVFDGGTGTGGDGVGLVDAVTASCAIPGAWPPVGLAGRRWIDGGVHSTANAHLAAGWERVVVVAPTATGSKAVHSPARQAAALTAAGARVEVITPDADAKAVIGVRALDPAQRGAAARAGRAQAAAHAKAVAAVWRG